MCLPKISFGKYGILDGVKNGFVILFAGDEQNF